MRFADAVTAAERVASLASDAATKQGGEYVFDRQYVVSLLESATRATERVVADLNVLVGHRELAAFSRLDELHAAAARLLAEGETTQRRTAVDGGGTAPVDAASLSRALAAATVVVDHAGIVASRGVAAGPVVKLLDPGDLATAPAGFVLVVEDLDDVQLDEEVLSAAAAVLCDRGDPNGVRAATAQSRRVPALVGLRDATARFATGSVVTVDADEGVVYAGRVGALVDYYVARRDAGEEPEYVLLRRMRQEVFPVTLGAGPTAFGDAATMHDVVVLALELAARELAEVALTRAPADERRDGAASLLRIVDLRPGGPEEASDGSWCRPLRALLAGARAAGGSAQASGTLPRGVALAKPERAVLVVERPTGFDLVCATLLAGASTLYCRIAGDAGGGADVRRPELAATALGRLGFHVTRASGVTTGMAAGGDPGVMERRTSAVGALLEMLGGGRADAGPGIDPEDVLEGVQSAFGGGST